MLKTRITLNDKLLIKGLFSEGFDPIQIDRALQIRDGTTSQVVNTDSRGKVKFNIKLTASRNSSSFNAYMDGIAGRLGYNSFEQAKQQVREFTNEKIPQWNDDYPCVERTKELYDPNFERTKTKLDQRGLTGFKKNEEIGLMRALYVAGESLEGISRLLCYNEPQSVRREIIGPRAREYPRTKEGMLEAAGKKGLKLSEYFDELAKLNGYNSFNEVRTRLS